MSRFSLWAYVILMFVIGALGWASTVWTLERQTEHETSTTDDLTRQYPQ